MTFTEKQLAALKLLHNDNYRHVLFYGGARSGKTYVIISDMVAVAYQYPGSRQLIARFRYSHVKSAIWEDTLPKILKQYPQQSFKLNHSDLTVDFLNGSKIVLCGLDSNDRVDRILGQEYCRIYLNECSQISYKAAQISRTRLAQKVTDIHGDTLINKMIYDLNPTEYSHWTYKLFFLHKDIYDNIIPDAPAYMHMQLNPHDNINNLSDNFIQNELDTLPESERIRFLHGNYQNKSGGIFNKFLPEKHVISILPEYYDEYYVGVDLITYAAVLVGKVNNTYYVIDEYDGTDKTAAEVNTAIISTWGKHKYTAYIDHNLGDTGRREISNSVLADKGPGSVEAGINTINQLLESDNIYISHNCLKLIGEISNYRRDSNGHIIKRDDHFIDALRMVLYSARNTYDMRIRRVDNNSNINNMFGQKQNNTQGFLADHIIRKRAGYHQPRKTTSFRSWI